MILSPRRSYRSLLPIGSNGMILSPRRSYHSLLPIGSNGMIRSPRRSYHNLLPIGSNGPKSVSYRRGRAQDTIGPKSVSYHRGIARGMKWGSEVMAMPIPILAGRRERSHGLCLSPLEKRRSGGMTILFPYSKGR